MVRGAGLVVETRRDVIARLHELLGTRRGVHPIGYAPPEGFAAYARILHPIPRGVGASIPDVTWRDIAEITGRRIEARTRWRDLVTHAEDDLNNAFVDWETGPFQRGLPERECRALADILRPVTGDALCTFGVWSGFADLDRDVLAIEPQCDVAGRSTVLMSGPIGAASTDLAADSPVHHYRSANVWMPPNSEWLVTSDVYAHVTLVAGPADVVARVISDGRLEVQAIDFDDLRSGQCDSAGA